MPKEPDEYWDDEPQPCPLCQRMNLPGAGDVCEVKSAPAMQRLDNSEIVAVMRRDRARAQDYAERHGFGKLIFDTEKALAAADGATTAKERSGYPEPVLPDSSREEVEGVRQELREMREALVGASQRFAS